MTRWRLDNSEKSAEALMNLVHRLSRFLTRRTGMLLRLPRGRTRRGGRHPAWTVFVDHALAGAWPGPYDHHFNRRASARGRANPGKMRTRVLTARLPHIIQLCVHCRDSSAGFWVSCTGGQTVRRPWCLSCCQALNHERFDVIPLTVCRMPARRARA
jgi:hypothetical protein